MGTTTTFVYDKSRRAITQHSSAEAHYYSYNQRNMVTQIQDVSASPDTIRYFTYNALGERVYDLDGTAMSYWAYDGNRMLSESVAGTTARYQHDNSPLPLAGSIVEHLSALDFTQSYPVFKEDGSVMQMRIGASRDRFETNKFGVVLGSSVVATSPPSHRFQNMSGLFATSVAVSQQTNLSRTRAFLSAQAMFTSGLALSPTLLGLGTTPYDDMTGPHPLEPDELNEDGIPAPKKYKPRTWTCCGPDITSALVAHLNDVMSKERRAAVATPPFIPASGFGLDAKYFGAGFGSSLGNIARIAIKTAEVADANWNAMRPQMAKLGWCPSPECSGTVTFAKHCISTFHVRHILWLAYLTFLFGREQAYGLADVHEKTGVFHGETLGKTYTKGWGTESSDVAAADREMNDISIRLAEKFKGPGSSITNEDAEEVFSHLTGKYAAKPATGMPGHPKKDLSKVPSAASDWPGYDTKCPPCDLAFVSEFNKGLELPPNKIVAK